MELRSIQVSSPLAHTNHEADLEHRRDLARQKYRRLDWLGLNDSRGNTATEPTSLLTFFFLRATSCKVIAQQGAAFPQRFRGALYRDMENLRCVCEARFNK